MSGGHGTLQAADIDFLKNVVASLKSRGVQVALDDFGTGFSAASLIREIPFDLIKIERGFVTTIEKSEKDRLLIGSMVDLASIFGAKVCVEGIETAGCGIF